MKRRKQILAVLLAASVAVPNAMMGIPMVQAEETTVGDVVEEGLVFEKTDVTITANSPVNLTSESYSEKLFSMEEGTIVVSFTSTGSSGQSLFSIANGTSGNNNNNRHFHVYVDQNGTLGCEIRKNDQYKVATNAGIDLSKKNTIAFVGDKTKNKYFLYANGRLVSEVDASTLTGGFRFANSIEEADTILLGATQRNGQPGYPFSGTIHSIKVYDKALSQEELGDSIGEPLPISMGSDIKTMFNNSHPDNSWVFTGGEAVAGGWQQNQGARNYMGQFEEYVRFTTAGNNEYGRQRYVFNTGRAGNSLTEVLRDYDTLVTDFSPKAVAYLVGPEDYEKGDSAEVLQQFQADIKDFITRSIGIKENNGGFVVIQKPYAVADAETNAVIQKYCDAIDTVIASYTTDSVEYPRIIVVDHFQQTNTTDFKDTCLTEDGFLNAKGHLEIGKQLSKDVCGSVNNYPNGNVNLNLVPTAQPEEYLDVRPEITAGDTSLGISIPEETQGPWKYQVTTEDVTVKGSADGNTFTISGLPSGKAYTLKIQSQDGKRQLVTMKGTIATDSQAEKDSQQLDALQQKLADLMKEKESMKWLFMGDSITHAANFNYGYAGISELFEKFLKDDLGRTKDFVINTAVYGTTLNNTINNIQYRLKNYAPDVVTVMLGTNDSNSTVENTGYIAKLKQMIQTIRELNKDAVIVLRTPIPTLDRDQGSPNWNRINNLSGYIEAVKTVAAEENCILLNQYDQWDAELQAYPWYRTKGRDFIFGDFLHPNPRGQIMMFENFVRACGLWTEDSRITNLFYEMPITEQENTTKPMVRITQDLGVRLSVENLRESSKLSLGQVTLKLTDKETGQSYENTVELEETEVTLPTLPAGVYEAEVMGYLTNTATHMSFEKQDITISEEGYEESTKQLLTTMISSAEKEDSQGYTSTSWAALESALVSAKETKEKENVTIEEVEAAITALEKAMAELVSKAAKIQGVTVSAVGTQNATSGAESAAVTLDGDPATFWHSNYNNSTDKSSYDNHWITFDLGKNYMVSQLRYLSRPTGNNGNIKSYEISISLDGKDFTKISDGNWSGIPATWYESDFKATEARYVKLKVLDATSVNSDKFTSASEFEIIGYEKTENSGETDQEVTEIQNLINNIQSNLTSLENHKEEQYTPENWEEFQDIVTRANQFVTDSETTLPTKAAAEAMLAEVQGIQSLIGLSKADFQTKIDEIKEAVGDADVYTTTTWNTYQTALTVAEECAADASLSDNERIAKYRELLTAYEGLQEKTTVAVTGVILNKTELTLTVGAEEALQATVTPEDAMNQSVSWTTSNDTVAIVDDNGKVTAIVAGEASIIVTTEDGGQTATCKVTVVDDNAEDGGEGGGDDNTEDGENNDTLQQEIAAVKAALENIIVSATTKKQQEYTVESWNLFAKALQEAKSAKESQIATKEDLQTAKNNLETAMAGLKPAPQTPPEGDSQGGTSGGDNNQSGSAGGNNAAVQEQQKLEQKIKDLVSQAANFNPNEYTTDSWNLYKEALDKVNQLISSGKATVAELTKAEAELQKIQNALVKVPATPTPEEKPQESTKPGTTFADPKGTYQFKIKSDSEAIFTGVTKSIKTVKIANTVQYAGKTLKVTGVAPKALRNDKVVTKVVLGKYVKEIGVSAFEGCSKLTSVNLKNVTKISNKAFKKATSLKKVTIPKKVTNLGKSVFEGCSKLSKITIKATALKRVGKNTFKNISAKAKIKVPKKNLAKYKKTLKNKGQGKKVKIG